MIPSRPCVATNSEIGAGEEDEIERRSFTRPTQLSRSSKTPTFAPQAIDPVVGPCPQVHRGGSSWEISIRVWIVGAWGFNLINYVIWIVDCSNLDGESREVPLCNIYLCFVDKSFWSFRSYSSARPIVRAGMEGINGARCQKVLRSKNVRGARRSSE
ncbi:unnamed protein product [Musa hybrid cultivar]